MSVNYCFLVKEKGSWNSRHFRDYVYWCLALLSCRKRKMNHKHIRSGPSFPCFYVCDLTSGMSWIPLRIHLQAKVWVSHMGWGGDQGHRRRMWAGTLLGIAIWTQGTEVRRSLVWLEVRSDSSQDLFGKWWQFSSYSETGRSMAVYLRIFIISFIYLFFTVLGLCRCRGFPLVVASQATL